MTTTERKIYMDFQEGNGFRDVTSITCISDFSITHRAFNDTYHYAQDELSMSILYNADLWNLIRSATKDIIVRVIDISTDVALTTEEDYFLSTEDGFYLALEQEIATPIFYGHIAYDLSWSYNGLTSNSIMALTATDELDTLNVSCKDILYANCKICDPSNPDFSIVHKLALHAGWSNIRVSSSVLIDITIRRFAPTEDNVLSVLDTLLYEYGYSLSLSSDGKIAPVKWMYEDTAVPTFEFDDNNIIDAVSAKQSKFDYDAVDITYYDLKLAKDILLYRDPNCGYADDGSFAGYNIIAGYTYPPETNVIDETTGSPTIVYQEYDTTAIKYRTNKAIENNLDYNYKAFKSNFSAFVATENHYRDVRYSTGIVDFVTPEFYNLKCRIVYNNPTSDSGLKLYYNNVYGDVWYRSAELKSIIKFVDTPTDKYSYTTSYVFDKTHADNLTKILAAQYKSRRMQYTFNSEEFCDAGTLVRLYTSDGEDRLCFILTVVNDEETGLYAYTLISASVENIAVSGRDASIVTEVDITKTYPYVTTVGTPSSASKYVASYRGIGILNSLTINAFTGATVSEAGVITVGSAVNAINGDWMINYSAVNAPIGMYYWDTNIWILTTNVDYISSSAIDLCNLQVGGITVSGFTTFITAIVKPLFAQQIKLLTGGNIQDVGYTAGVSGFNIKSDGQAEFSSIKARGSYTNGKLFGIDGDFADKTEEGLYIGGGQELYTHIDPINGDNNTVNWHVNAVLTTYTAETFVSDYIRAVRLESGYFAILLSANTFGIYKYKLGAITKVVSVTIPTSITIVETCDILNVGGNPIDGFYIGIQDNNVLRIYIVYMSGTISLQKTITFPVNVRNILSCAGTHQYSHTFIVESYRSTDQTDIYLYGYTWNTSTLNTTPLATIASLVNGGSHVQQNQMLQYNLYRDGEESKYMQSVLLGNNIIRYKINDVSISAVYSSVGYEDFGGSGDAIGYSGRGSIFGNAIFIFSSIYDKYAVKTWRGGNADTSYTDAFDGISVSSTGSPHRLIPLKYGTMACIGANFGGIKVISISPNI